MKGLWIYRAENIYGLPVSESYSRQRLIEKLIEEFGKERLPEFKIKKIFDKTLE